MLSSVETLRLEIDIARIAAECAVSKDPEKRARLQARLMELGAKRDSTPPSRSALQWVAVEE